MAIFRVLKKLSRKDHIMEPGSLSRFEWLAPEQIAVLEKQRAISRLSAPPLSEMPGWKRRGQKLEDIGIETAEDLLEADGEVVAGLMNVRAATVDRWKTEAEWWLVVPPKAAGR